ncbi:MAG: aminopeptidase [Catalinimonas sp.]
MMTTQKVTFDPAFQEGAHSAINVCLRLQPHESIAILTDNETLEIASALLAEVEQVGAKCHFFVWEDHLPRPAKEMPAAFLEALETADVSIFCAQAQTGELRARIQMSDVINRRALRHGHMVNINRQIMLEGMRADFRAIDELSSRLIAKARRAETIRVTSAAGTDLVARFTPEIKWIKTSGLITPEKWGNLPGGEIFTSPVTVDGTFVVDGVVGDYLCEKYGDLKATPLTIDLKEGRIQHLACDNQELLDEFNTYTHTDENSDRAGEFAIGTNIAVKEVIGHILQDEKIPGIHIAFGHPYSEHTGAKWRSTTHIDCVMTGANIWLDDEQVMADGTFTF